VTAALREAEGRLAELKKVEREVEGLRIAIAAMQGNAIPRPTDSTKRTDYQDLGVTAAAKAFLRERGEPLDTSTIATALLNRGLKTHSKNFIATVYATLRNGPNFRRTADQRWQLVE
jgi:hypothetical protein